MSMDVVNPDNYNSNTQNFNQYLNQPNPFLNILQKNQQNQIQQIQQFQPFQKLCQQTTNPITNPINNDSLFNKIKNLKLPNLNVYEEKEIMNLFGQDISGIDICCVRNNEIIAIKYDYIGSGTSLKNLTHFLYCCSVIEQQYGPIKKIFIGCLQFDNQTMTALNRNKIDYHINGSLSVLNAETANYVKNLYN